MKLLFLLMVFAFWSLIFVFVRTLMWVTNKKFTKKHAIITAVLMNLVLIAAMFRINSVIYEVFATLLTLLWIYALCAIIIGILFLCFRKKENIIQILKPSLIILFISTAIYGYYNTYHPVVIHYDIKLNKKFVPFKLALVADLHLGNQMGNKEISKLAELISQEKPDIIVMPGDIINDNPDAYYQSEMDKELQKIKTPIIGSLGNHEYYGKEREKSIGENIKAIRDGGINLLIDEAIIFDNKWVFVGRDDYTNGNRKKLNELIHENWELPVIVLDHQPREISSVANLNLDIQVSGHTHKGQVFPMNIVVNSLYELAYGHKEINGKHFFTTSGYGFWGSPFRIGSRAEIFIINVSPK